MSDPTVLRTIEGDFSAPKDATFAIVAARFNDFIVENLVAGAVDGLVRHGVPRSAITVVRTPGAFELPLVAQRLAKGGKFSAIIALGAVIRGSTPHFDYVCSAAASGCSTAMAQSGLPVIFGVLTTDTIEQAVERAGTKAGNKGYDAAVTAIEMVSVLRQLGAE
jgi:6,7-dimethyl-8-ribityllumazine synthase